MDPTFILAQIAIFTKQILVSISFNVLAAYTYNGQFRIIYYDTSSSLIYVASQATNYVWVFNLNLGLSTTINVGSINDGINYFNSSLYFSLCRNSEILVYQNSVLTKIYYATSSCGSSTECITSINFDTFGNMLVVCWVNQKFCLYDYNGNDMNLCHSTTQSTSSHPYQVLIDTKGRLIVLDFVSILIYY